MDIYSPPHLRPPLGPLTGIRFIAALAVLLFHSGAGFAVEINLHKYFVTLLENGYLGVSMFFTLSGFILTYNYADKSINFRINLRLFALSRFARVYPTYALCLIIMLPLILNSRLFSDPFDVGCVLIMIQSWSLPSSPSGYAWIMQAWTLSIELLFYISFPIILPYLSRLNWQKLKIALAICIAFIVIYATPTATPASLERPFGSEYIPLPILRMGEFVYGMLLCLAFFMNPKLRSLAKTEFAIYSIVIIIVLISSTTKNVYAISSVSVLIGFFIFQLAASQGIIANILGSSLMLVLGGSSYALYLLQGPIREWFRYLPSETWARAAYPAVLIGLSVIVFFIWEQPLRKKIIQLSLRPQC